MPLKILVTGGSGFIGSALVRILINEYDHDVINIDKNHDNEKIKLSMSYTENNNKICLYIKNDTKIFREIPIDKECPSEI